MPWITLRIHLEISPRIASEFFSQNSLSFFYRQEFIQRFPHELFRALKKNTCKDFFRNFSKETLKVPSGIPSRISTKMSELLVESQKEFLEKPQKESLDEHEKEFLEKSQKELLMKPKKIYIFRIHRRIS